MNSNRIHSIPAAKTSWVQAGLLAASLVAALPCWAQYKVIGPDGKITYTDRAPNPNDGKVSTVNTRGVGGSDVPLPIELRQPVARYPVTLYTAPTGCDPCESGRQYLRQRGIPFTERQMQNADDGVAVERLFGSRDVPVLSIGSQVLRGFSPAIWGSYLDAAAYPRESRLPEGYQFAAPVPVVERAVPQRTPPATGGVAAPQPTNPTGIKF